MSKRTVETIANVETMFLPLVIRISKTSKMPCSSYSLPAQACITGSMLNLIEGSVCFYCYARKNMYHMPSVREPRDWNLAVWQQCVKNGQIEKWIDAMVQAIGIKAKFFRFFDSGDIQSVKMLEAIIAVANRLPDCKFWLPTHEQGILVAFKKCGYAIPANLIIRKSANMLGFIDNVPGYLSCSVGAENMNTHQCKAYTQGGKCGSCRDCWDTSIQNINYPLH